MGDASWTREGVDHCRGKSSAIPDRGWLVRRALLVADLIGLIAAFVVVQLIFGAFVGLDDAYSGLEEAGFFLAAALLWAVAAKLHGLYDRDEERADSTTADDLVGVLHVLTLGTWIVFAVVSLSGLGDPVVGAFLLFWGLGMAFVTSSRAGARAFCRRHPVYRQNTLIIGAGDVGQLIALKLLQHPEHGIDVLGFVDAEPKVRRDEVATIPILGTIDDLLVIVTTLDVERVIIAFSADSHQQTLDLMRMLNEFDLRIDIVPRLFEVLPPSADVHMLGGLSLIGLPRSRLPRSSLLLKRTSTSSWQGSCFCC